MSVLGSFGGHHGELLPWSAKSRKHTQRQAADPRGGLQLVVPETDPAPDVLKPSCDCDTRSVDPAKNEAPQAGRKKKWQDTQVECVHHVDANCKYVRADNAKNRRR
jgi:hypothetical protein